MSISGISPSVSMLHASQSAQRPDAISPPSLNAQAKGPDFAERLGQAVQNLSTQQSKAAEAAKDFETGRTDDIAAVMVEQQVASLGFQLTMQVRNKALTAYRDIMNMPV